ncbi:MAG TPA: rhomboid family intramembrane serine protease [Candidatus Limnocylindrales bacterium]|nr:rhomboid family intramembrane serine protease [Candidatus Limnocylindrales bacterium]
MIPLRDANPTRRAPVVTLALIAACFAVFAVELSVEASGGEAALGELFGTWGAVPSVISAAFSGDGDMAAAWTGIFGSLFLHGGWLHLLGNMLFLWIFGNNIEDRLGRLPFLVFYLVGGIAAALTQVWIDPSSEIPLVGASGAIAATLGAYLVLYPRARILTLVFLGFFYQLIEVPAVFVLGFWFVLQLIDGVASLGATTAQGGVAFFAHIGGFVAGMVVGAVVRATTRRPRPPAW